MIDTQLWHKVRDGVVPVLGAVVEEQRVDGKELRYAANPVDGVAGHPQCAARGDIERARGVMKVDDRGSVELRSDSQGKRCCAAVEATEITGSGANGLVEGVCDVENSSLDNVVV